MLFNSCEFVVFFLMVTALYYALPHGFRWAWLLLASCYFYAVFVPKYLLILASIILIDYAAGLLIARAEGGWRRVYLGMSLAANLGILGFFKYGNFAQAELHRFVAWLGHAYEPRFFSVVLPIGLSFHTFQSISYTIEVYRRKYPPEHHLGIYALYVLFYPQMVAGPIERPQSVLPQLHEEKRFDGDRFLQGVGWMVWGAFKKIVIADNLTLLVDPVYANPAQHHGWPLLLATYAFAFQIFCDFSGYSDIARGAALAMGIDLMKNFAIPYHAQSIAEFWRRWHISLSTWFRDYLYIPLGGSRAGVWLTYRNLMIVFIVSGLWHGASWAFVAWGALHGCYLILGMITQSHRQRLWQHAGLQFFRPIRPFLSTLVTFHLVLFAWIFFRAGSLSKAGEVIRGLCDLSGGVFLNVPQLTSLQWWGLILGLLLMEAMHLRPRGFDDYVRHWPAVVRCLMLFFGFLAILVWGRLESKDFIYFQF